jgi:hypothetical protein
VANLGQRSRILLIGKDVSAEGATRFGLGNESRFQRCRLADLRKPGALPQAKTEVAPSALIATYRNHFRVHLTRWTVDNRNG